MSTTEWAVKISYRNDEREKKCVCVHVCDRIFVYVWIYALKLGRWSPRKRLSLSVSLIPTPQLQLGTNTKPSHLFVDCFFFLLFDSNCFTIYLFTFRTATSQVLYVTLSTKVHLDHSIFHTHELDGLFLWTWSFLTNFTIFWFFFQKRKHIFCRLQYFNTISHYKHKGKIVHNSWNPVLWIFLKLIQ